MWEKIPDSGCNLDTCCATQRLKVPGGWLVRTILVMAKNMSFGNWAVGVGGPFVAQTFVADLEHVWQLGKE